jgi:hypothetical protein
MTYSAEIGSDPGLITCMPVRFGHAIVVKKSPWYSQFQTMIFS